MGDLEVVGIELALAVVELAEVNVATVKFVLKML